MGVPTQEPLDAPFLNGLFFSGFSKGKRPIRTKSGKRPIEVEIKVVGGSQDRVVSTRLVLADGPWTPKPGTRAQKTERRYQKLE